MIDFNHQLPGGDEPPAPDWTPEQISAAGQRAKIRIQTISKGISFHIRTGNVQAAAKLMFEDPATGVPAALMVAAALTNQKKKELEEFIQALVLAAGAREMMKGDEN